MSVRREPPTGPPTVLRGRRVMLRALVPADFEQWRDVRWRSAAWLLKWEPRPGPRAPDPTSGPGVFVARCEAREREWHLGTGHGFGIFVDDRVAGEINLNSIQRGPFQNAYVGYWIDEALAGKGYVPESLVLLAAFAFEELVLHRIQVAIIPRNLASHRVVEKLGMRQEGLAERYLQINGVWEDHVRYAMTAEEWAERRAELFAAWIDRPDSRPRWA